MPIESGLPHLQGIFFGGGGGGGELLKSFRTYQDRLIS